MYKKIITIILLLTSTLLVASCDLEITFNPSRDNQVSDSEKGDLETNEVYELKQRSSVSVIRINYVFEDDEYTPTGANVSSGVVFHKYINDETGYKDYWILTNNHVVAIMENRDHASHQIRDYFGRISNATVVHSCRYYDLAVLHTRRPLNNANYLLPIQMETANASIGVPVILMARPQIPNSPSRGYTTRFRYSTIVHPDVEVNFRVLATTAYSRAGFSGAALLNENLNLIGIHFAAGSIYNGHREASSIPIEKVHDFLNEYVWYQIDAVKNNQNLEQGLKQLKTVSRFFYVFLSQLK